jgi:hypothetical protein
MDYNTEKNSISTLDRASVNFPLYTKHGHEKFSLKYQIQHHEESHHPSHLGHHQDGQWAETQSSSSGRNIKTDRDRGKTAIRRYSNSQEYADLSINIALAQKGREE